MTRRGWNLRGAATLLLVCASAAASAQPVSPALTAPQIASLLAGPDRSDADRRTDGRRKPAELLGFIGVRPGMAVLDLSAGGGYTSELLARAVGPSGHVYAQSPPRRPGPAAASAAPPRTSAMAIAARAERSGLTQLSAVVQPFDAPVPVAVAAGGLDLVTLMFNYHDLGYAGVDRGAMNAAVFAALRPGGAYVIADHAGRPGTGISESNTLHRIEEAFLRREVEAAGFRFVAEGGFLRNPDDPRDREEPVPEMAKDGFVIRFVKP